MHEATLRREMLSTLNAYKANPRPEGANVRKMTADEVQTWTDSVAFTYQNLQEIDNAADDRDKTAGRIDIQNRSVDNGILDGPNRVSEENVSATFGGRSKAYTVVQDLRSYPEDGVSGSSHDSTFAGFAEQNIGFITGIQLRRDGNDLQTTSFFIDRFNPENCLISEGPRATAREI